MGKSKCGCKPRIVSSVVQSMGCNKGNCKDVCTNPICGEPGKLGIFAPLIYDEIGINLCATFAIGTDISTTYPTVTSASVKVINVTYPDGATGVQIERISGRPNCYLITLSNITVQFAIHLFDASCRLVDTLYQTAIYLPSDTGAATYDEDTNPSSVELEIFAPYGVSYDTTATPPTPQLNYVGFSNTDNFVRQGINLYSIGKLINFNVDDDTVTVGLTLVLQSLYYAGYKVKSEGKIDVPKGSIMAQDNSDCMRFVAGDLLNLAIKPLDLGIPDFEEELKRDCKTNVDACGGNCIGESNRSIEDSFASLAEFGSDI